MKIFSACLLSLFFFSCNPTSAKEKTIHNNSDSLNPTVSYYLVGRIRITQIERGIPFAIKVIKCRPELFGKKMPFRMLDSTSFKIVYTKNNKPIEVLGSYGKEFVTQDFDIIVSKTEAFDKIQALRDIRDLNYLFEIE